MAGENRWDAFTDTELVVIFEAFDVADNESQVFDHGMLMWREVAIAMRDRGVPTSSGAGSDWLPGDPWPG